MKKNKIGEFYARKVRAIILFTTTVWYWVSMRQSVSLASTCRRDQRERSLKCNVRNTRRLQASIWHLGNNSCTCARAPCNSRLTFECVSQSLLSLLLVVLDDMLGKVLFGLRQRFHRRPIEAFHHPRQPPVERCLVGEVKRGLGLDMERPSIDSVDGVGFLFVHVNSFSGQLYSVLRGQEG